MPIPSDDHPVWKQRIKRGKPWYESRWNGWKLTISVASEPSGFVNWCVFREDYWRRCGHATVNVSMPCPNVEEAQRGAEAFVRLIDPHLTGWSRQSISRGNRLAGE